jgi:hypothetical protein
MKNSLETLTVYKIHLYGDRMAEVSHSMGSTRIALEWHHLNDDYNKLTEDGENYITLQLEEKFANCCSDIKFKFSQIG